MKKIALINCILIFSAAVFMSSRYAEGMFPLSDIPYAQLKKAGLKLSQEELYNPGGTSLIDALVRVGGCTGSFVSEEGLIITNHHCAFSATAAVSSPEQDYISNGFWASTKQKELSTGISCRITVGYEDVSTKVLQNVPADDAEKRTATIKENIKRITEEASKNNPGFEIEISEMLAGTSYTLFKYQQIKDVRLVYVPPRCIGEFGGESDNWVWPRHNGDFALLRAYVAPDGSPAAYSEKNVPYKPKRVLQINPNGLKENDFVFILGYPGRTFRNMPYRFVKYQDDHTLKNVSEWYDYQISAMEEVSQEDKATEIALSSRIKSLANVTKNYKGKLQGLKRTPLLEKKHEEENQLKQYIQSDEALKQKYGNLFADIDRLYDQLEQNARLNYLEKELFNSTGATFLWGFISFHSSIYSSLKPDQQKTYLTGILPAQEALLEKNYKFDYMEVDKKLIVKLLSNLLALPESERPQNANQVLKNKQYIKDLVDDADKRLHSWDKDSMLALFDKHPEKFLALQHPLIEFCGELYLQVQQTQEREKRIYAELEKLNAQLIAVKQSYYKKSFLPDANATLRLTYGKIRGYQPNDAEYHQPFTTVNGIIEKAEIEGDYYIKKEILEIMKKVNSNNVVCMLYDLDTTGGNSGSPIMDARGQLVGVNFDRAFTACINDYGWNDSYSRSIGVDIRYVLFVLKEIAKADNLLKELKTN